ncbi:MAG TPA: phosphatidate cytidylyltransferase, partial [Kiloniellaceae bacterium]
MLMTRILSAAVLAPLVLLAIHAGGLWLAAFMSAAGAVMGWEWARMCNGGSLGPAGLVAMATLAGLAPA